jgi:SAM-dependent methyltransferase
MESAMTTTTAFDWSAVAPAWDAHRGDAQRDTFPVTEALRGQLDLREGERVLELGSGTGDHARRLAELVGPAGSVLATDVAQGMVELTAGALADVPHAEARRVDAADTGLPDEGFDAVAFVMGLMFVPEPERAVSEIRRVLRPGGRAGIAVWAGPDKNPWLSSCGMAAMVHGVVAGGPPTGPGGLFSLADPARLTEVLQAGGFPDALVQEVPVAMRWPDADAWFDQVSSLAGPLAVALAGAPHKLDDVRATAKDLIGRFTTADGLVGPGQGLLAVVRR